MAISPPRPVAPITGPRIAFLQYVRTPGGGNANLVTVNPGGSDKRIIAEHVDPDLPGPSWSADGRRVVFYGNRDHLGLWIANADGSKLRRLLACAPPTCPSDDVALSPDGSRLALVRSFLGPAGRPASSVEVIDVASGRVRVLCRYPVCGPGLAQPTWSPDGTRLAFSQANKASAPEFASPASAIFVVDADGRDLRQLTDVGCTPSTACSADVDPAWSPDGRTIAFQRNVIPAGTIGSSTWEIVLMASEASYARILPTCHLPVFSLSPPVAPAWSPDGSLLAYPAPDGGIVVIRASDGRCREIRTCGPGGCWGAEELTWSPDGRSFAFAGTTLLYAIGADGTGMRELAQAVAGGIAWLPAPRG